MKEALTDYVSSLPGSLSYPLQSSPLLSSPILSSLPSSVMSSLTVVKAVELMQKGNVFTKFHEKTNKAAKRFMFYERGMLYWCKEGSRSQSAKHSCSLAHISRVSTFKSGNAIFQRNDAAAKTKEELILILWFAEAGMSLNLAAATKELRDTWVQAINLVHEALSDKAQRSDSNSNNAANEMKYNPSAAASSASDNNNVLMRSSSLGATSPERIEEGSEEDSDDEDWTQGNANAARSVTAALAVSSSKSTLPAPAPSPTNRTQARGAPVSNRPLPKTGRPGARAGASPFDLAVLPDPLPAPLQRMVDVALASIVGGMKGRIRQKMEDSAEMKKRIQNLTQHLDDLEQRNAELEAIAEQGGGQSDSQHELEWNSLAIRTQTTRSGLIEIRMGCANLEHEPPHQYVAILYIKHPLEEVYEYSQTVSLMRSPDGGETYFPKLLLSPTELFAFRHADEEEEGGNGDEEADVEENDIRSGDESAGGVARSVAGSGADSPKPFRSKRGSMMMGGRNGAGSGAVSPTSDAGSAAAAPEGELVGAQLKIEIWDLINKQMYDLSGGSGGGGGDQDEHLSPHHRGTPRRQSNGALNSSRDSGGGNDDFYNEVEQSGYQGHVEFDMNELIGSRHHVLALPITNTINPRKESEWSAQNVALVLQYCLPAAAENRATSPVAGRKAGAAGESSATLAGGATDPILTLRLQSLEDELTALHKSHADLQHEHVAAREASQLYIEEKKVRQALETRLQQEQIVRVRHEQEVMRLRPRAMELVDTSDELTQARKKAKELELALIAAQKELRSATLPATAHAMLDELLSISTPSSANLSRIKKFILEQERVRTMLVEEMAAGQKHFITYETTHDELIRRETALNSHVHGMESDKRKLEIQNQELVASIQALQAQVMSFSTRLEESEKSNEHLHVSTAFLTEQNAALKAKIDAQERSLLVHSSSLASMDFTSVAQKQLAAREREVEMARREKEEAMQLRELVRQQQQQNGHAGGHFASPPRRPRKKIQKNDALEQTLSAAGNNWEL